VVFCTVFCTGVGGPTGKNWVSNGAAGGIARAVSVAWRVALVAAWSDLPGFCAPAGANWSGDGI